MPLKVIHPHHAEVMGRGLVLLSSPHITAAKRDLYAGQIVEEAALLSKSWAIIAKEGKQLGGDEAQSCLPRSEEHTSELQSPCNLVCRLLLEKKKTLESYLHRYPSPTTALAPAK